MSNIFKALLAGGLLGAIVLIFSLFNKEEVKQEQRVRDAVQALQEQQFDDEFSDAWNGAPGSQIKKQRNEHLADLKNKASQAKAKRDSLDEFFDEAVDGAKQAVREEDARLGTAIAKQNEIDGRLK